MVMFPELIDLQSDFPTDAVSKAKTILDHCDGRSTGAYTDGPGIEIIRKHASMFIERRDGFPSYYGNIILTTGATEAARQFLKLFMSTPGKKAGVLIPIPQYPLYSATLEEFDLGQIDYYLDEENNWAINIKELEKITLACKSKYCPRVMVIINPGNPTGQVLDKKNIQELIKFAYREKLIILADEVYQQNVYNDSEFHSFKKVMMEMGEPFSRMELVSIFSASKGYSGECGLRGGFIEVVNMDPDVQNMLIKSVNAKSCPTIYGQIAMDCITDPPQKGNPSFSLFEKEKCDILHSLAKKARKLTDGLNKIEGLTCNLIQGALYAFPKINMPPKAIEAARLQNRPPDELYALELLRNTGVFVFPGSSFGQVAGTYHFRSTILPTMQDIDDMLRRIETFQIDFMQKYS